LHPNPQRQISRNPPDSTSKCRPEETSMSRHRNIRNLTEDDYDDYYVS